MTHELDLLGILHDAQGGHVAMQAWHQARNGGAGAGRVEGIEEGQVTTVLHRNHPRACLHDALGRPVGGIDDVHVDLPAGVLAQAVLEGAEVARVGVQPEPVPRDEGRVGDLVVEGAFGAGEPAKVGVVAQDGGIIAPLGHEAPQPLDAPCAGICLCHVNSFRRMGCAIRRRLRGPGTRPRRAPPEARRPRSSCARAQVRWGPPAGSGWCAGSAPP